MLPRFCNLLPAYPPILRQCVAERLWIRQTQRWHGPYDWAWKFGVTYMGLDWEPEVADPYILISKARADRSVNRKTLAAIGKFEKRVDAYYNSGKDQLLLKSIETGLWHYQA